LLRFKVLIAALLACAFLVTLWAFWPRVPDAALPVARLVPEGTTTAPPAIATSLAVAAPVPATAVRVAEVESPAADTPRAAEPTRQSCEAAVQNARRLAAGLPPGDGSRYFAERDLQQAGMEAGNGEFDECQEWAQRATDEVTQHLHQLKPGETIKVLGPDELPQG
jgi:hypothetical protein